MQLQLAQKNVGRQISDEFFCFHRSKFKGVWTFSDGSNEAEGLREVIMQSEQTDWLINNPAFHPLTEKAADYKGSVCWNGMTWRRDEDVSDNLSLLWRRPMWPKTKWWNYLWVYITQSISAWAALSRFHSNLITIVQTQGVRPLRKNLSQLPRAPCACRPIIFDLLGTTKHYTNCSDLNVHAPHSASLTHRRTQLKFKAH